MVLRKVCSALKDDGFDLHHFLDGKHGSLGANAGHFVTIEGLLGQAVISVAAHHAGCHGEFAGYCRHPRGMRLP